jgi:glycosyltransferase involved in cell wall biosynthesis
MMSDMATNDNSAINNKQSPISDQTSPLSCCVIIPTYNNADTLGGVIDSVLRLMPSVIVVNDGSTDETRRILDGYGEKISVISCGRNRGKGRALRQGFRAARNRGFEYAITIDSDGQHFAEDIALFIRAARENPQAILIGSREFSHENMPAKNTFANKFSNFWFMVQTARSLPDTQTGYRLYPLARIGKMRFFTSRYETELEILVRSAWRGIPLMPVPVKVFYAPEGERITHFRPFADFVRISILNTALTVAALIYGYPSMLINYLKKRIKKT